MRELAKQLDCLAVVGPRQRFSVVSIPKRKPFTIAVDDAAPFVSIGSPEDAFVPAFIVAVCPPILIILCGCTNAQVAAAAIQSVVILVVYLHMRVGDSQNESVHEDCRLFPHPGSDIHSTIKSVYALRPVGVPVVSGQPLIIGGIDKRNLSLSQRYFTIGLFGRGHAHVTSWVGFVRCYKHLTPQVYQEA